jgi:hypothetical protein
MKYIGLSTVLTLAIAAVMTEGLRVLILPGFGNDAIDYANPLGRGEDYSMVSMLAEQDVQADVVPIKRADWLNVAKSIFTKEFYTYDATFEGMYKFYCESVNNKLMEMQSRSSEPVVLVGHSAGGWLGRGLMGNGYFAEAINGDSVPTRDVVAGLVTLGTPNLPPVDQTKDATRGALRKVNEMFPGAHLKDDGIFYISVAGKAVQSDSNAPRSSMNKYAYGAYKEVFGDASVADGAVGDGVVPFDCMHLDGALQISIPEAYHSINAPENAWYGGSRAVADQWVGQMVKSYVSSQTKSVSPLKGSTRFSIPFFGKFR